MKCSDCGLYLEGCDRCICEDGKFRCELCAAAWGVEVSL